MDGNVHEAELRAILELVARHYSVQTVTKTIPGRTETVTETVTVEESYYRRVPTEPDGLLERLSRVLRRIFAFVVYLVEVCITFVATLFDQNTSIQEALQRCKDAYLDKLREIDTTLVSAVREVDRTVTRDIEIDPEFVEESVQGRNRVSAIGRGRIGFQAYQTRGGVLVTGPSGLMESKNIRYPVLHDAESLVQKSNDMEAELEHVPWVLDGSKRMFPVPNEAESYYDMNRVPLRGLERDVLELWQEVMATAFEDATDHLLRISAVTDNELISAMVPARDVNNISHPPPENLAYESGPQGEQFEALVEQWPARWAEVEQALLDARMNSLRDQVTPECVDLGTFVNYSAFNFYCPMCNEVKQRELLDRDYSIQANQEYEPVSFSANSRCLFDPDEDTWRCVACGNETSRPIPIHKMLDGVLLPAYDHLMNEHKVERLRAHQNVRNKEIENRNSLEAELERTQIEYLGQIDALGEEMQRIQVEALSERMAVDAMRVILEAYEIQQNNTMSSIRESSALTQAEIEERTESVLANVDEIKQQEMDSLNEELTELSKAKRMDDERRDALQRDILRESQQQVQLQRDASSQFDKIERRLQQGNAITYAKARGKKVKGQYNPDKNLFQRLWHGTRGARIS